MPRKRKPGKRTNGRLSRSVEATEDRNAVATAASRATALSTARAYRKRHLPPELSAMVDHPMAGCSAGRAILTGTPDTDWPDLWAAVIHMRRVYAAYDHVFGLNRFAKVAAILVPTTPMETSADAPAWDCRTDHEKQDAAEQAWTKLHGWMGRVSKAVLQACVDAVIHQTEERARNPEAVLLCLRAVSTGIKGA